MTSSPGGFVSVRRAAQTDAPSILECLCLAFEPYRADYTVEAFADTVLTPESLERRLAHMTVLVAEESGRQIVGTVAFNVPKTGEGHIRGMAVRPGWQGRGVAEVLLRQVESELRKVNCSRLSLKTTRPLERAIRFYKKHGFRPSGRETDFFGMPLFEYVKAL